MGRVKKIIFITLMIVGILAFGSYLYSSNAIRYKKEGVNNIISPNPINTKLFLTSNILNFSIEVPTEYNVTESVASVDIVTDSKTISIIRNSTNYINLRDYLSYYDSVRDLENTLVFEGVIDGYESVARVNYFSDTSIYQKTYYIYVNSDVYILSTKDEELYDDLDQIAKSFKYLPPTTF